MKRTSSNPFAALLRGTIAASAAVLLSGPVAFAGDTNAGLRSFLAHPASFVAVKDGMAGPVTYASMSNDTLSVEFVIPTHEGETVGEYVGTLDANGVFVGEGVLTPEHGPVRSAEVTISFEDNGTITASIDGAPQAAGFMPVQMQYGF